MDLFFDGRALVNFEELNSRFVRELTIMFRIILFISVVTLVYGGLAYALLIAINKLQLTNLLLLSLLPAVWMGFVYNLAAFFFFAWFCLWHASVSWWFFVRKRSS